jgi:hypothetical protein
MRGLIGDGVDALLAAARSTPGRPLVLLGITRVRAP